jgi:hypothetical protein
MSILLKPLIDGAPVNSVRPKITMSFDPIDRGYQTLAIRNNGAVALGIEEAFDGLGYQSQVFPGIASHHVRQRGFTSSL